MADPVPTPFERQQTSSPDTPLTARTIGVLDGGQVRVEEEIPYTRRPKFSGSTTGGRNFDGGRKGPGLTTGAGPILLGRRRGVVKDLLRSCSV